MKQPYEITLKDGVLPSVVINAPGGTARPVSWPTRLRWAWRCLRGKPLDIGPSVNLLGCRIETPTGAGITIQPPEKQP